jgi:hypothetical protein
VLCSHYTSDTTATCRGDGVNNSEKGVEMEWAGRVEVVTRLSLVIPTNTVDVVDM